MFERLDRRLFLSIQPIGNTLVISLDTQPGPLVIDMSAVQRDILTLSYASGVTQSFVPASNIGLIYVKGTSGPDRIDVMPAVQIPCRIVAAAGDDTLYGGSSATTLDGGDGNDVLFGGSGADSINGQSGADLIYGGGGNDTILGGSGSDTLNGGEGWDVLSYADHYGVCVTFDGIANDGAVNENDQPLDDTFEECWGSRAEDTLDMTAGDVGRALRGGSGNDLILGANRLTSGDSLYGDLGDDTLYGGSGDDRLDGGLGADLIVGDAGFDSVVYTSRTTPISVTLDGLPNDGETGEGDNLQTIERVIASPPIRTPVRVPIRGPARAIELIDAL
jgi:Ca2+-binding RTX toxin-like protein